MGTRSLTYLYEKPDDDPFVCIYRQYDGYPSGHGLEVAKFLNERRIVNGIPGGSKEILSNGMNCLAAQLITLLKESPNKAGDIYILSVSDKDCGQDYEYHIIGENLVQIKSYNGHYLFSGDYKEFLDYCSKKE